MGAGQKGCPERGRCCGTVWKVHCAHRGASIVFLLQKLGALPIIQTPLSNRAAEAR